MCGFQDDYLENVRLRIIVMVPLYAISSLISLFSLDAAFVIDAIRDIYEAFVIYCFFDLLVAYLGGERSLLIMLHGRPPKYPVFPANLLWPELDVSDPHTFLFLKRGILRAYLRSTLYTHAKQYFFYRICPSQAYIGHRHYHSEGCR